jgi:hypothetical protein
MQMKSLQENAAFSCSNLATTMQQMDGLVSGQAQYKEFGVKAWASLQSLTSAVAELMVRFFSEFVFMIKCTILFTSYIKKF